MNELYDLENKAYISFSGGKDSMVLSALIDLALPDNKIPRVFINTGIEYKAIVDFVKELGRREQRLAIIQPFLNIKQTLETYGYPLKSKEHSMKLAVYQRSGLGKTVLNYIGQGDKKEYLCPEKLRYQFTPEFTLKVSDKCCFKLKKEPAEKWAKEHNRPITITGIRKGEHGLRQSISGCAIFYDKECKELHKFHPLFVVDEKWVDEFVETYNVELCKLYYSPYNFKRTGCKGCGFSLDLQKQLDTMEVLMPEEKKQCEIIWKPVYDEYRKIGYRLRKVDNQPSLFEE